MKMFSEIKILVFELGAKKYPSNKTDFYKIVLNN